MANYLASVQPLLADRLMQMMEAASLKTSCPVPVEIAPLELPKDEPEGNETTKGRKRVAAEIKESTKEKFNAAAQDCKDKVDQAKQELVNKVKNAASVNPQKLKDLLMAIAELGIALGELVITCVAFPVRFALTAASIIGSCPIGPTVQPTQLVMTLKQFKEVGDDMGTKYSKAQAAWNKLGADELISGMKDNPIIEMIPGFAATLEPITLAFNLVNTVFTTTKPMITMVGGGVCSVSGGISAASVLGLPEPIMTLAADEWPGPFSIEGSDEPGQEVTMEAPDLEFDADPEACFNFTQAKDTVGITAANCTSFKVLSKDKYEDKEDKEHYHCHACDNCVKYKPFHKQITIRLRENTREIYGSNDLWLKGDTFTPLSGSLKYRMTSVENRCTALENRCTVLEGKVADNVGWSVSAGWDRDNKYIWVDLKNSKSQVLSPELTTSHSATFSVEDFHDTRVKDVKRVDIWKYDDIKSEDVKVEIDSLMGWIRTPIDTRDHNSIWGLEADLDDDSLDTVILYKEEEIPETDRIIGNTYIVYTFENSFGEELKPLWINVSLLSVKYDFLTSMDTVTKNYLNLDWEKVQEDHSMVVTANLKYTPAVAASISGVDEMASGINDVMKGISSANGQGKINNNE